MDLGLAAAELEVNNLNKIIEQEVGTTQSDIHARIKGAHDRIETNILLAAVRPVHDRPLQWFRTYEYNGRYFVEWKREVNW